MTQEDSKITFSGDGYAYPTGEEFFNRYKVTSNSLPFLNFTDLEQKIANSTYFEGVTPRWTLLADLRNPKSLEKRTSSVAMVIDTK